MSKNTRQQEINSLKETIAAKESEYSQKKELRTMFFSMKEAKKKGNVLLIIGLLLIPAEILSCLFYSPFQAVDLVIIGAFLIPGIARKISGMREYKELRASLAGVDTTDIVSQTAALGRELDDLKDTLKKKERAFLTGWNYNDLKNLDSVTAAQLEEDFIALMDILANCDAHDDVIITNWLRSAITENIIATVNKDTSASAKFDAVAEKLRATGRWPLAFLPLFILTSGLNVLNEVWNMGQHTTLDDAMKSANFPAPDDAYTELYANSVIAMERIVEAIVTETMQHM